MGVAANFLCSFNTTFGEGSLDLLEKLLGVGLGEAEVKDSLNCNCKTEDETQDDEGHEACTTFDELGLQCLVERNIGLYVERIDFAVNFFSCRLSYSFLFSSCSLGVLVLSECILCRKGHQACNCQKHENFFHNCFCVSLISKVIELFLYSFSSGEVSSPVLKSVQFSK